MKLLKIIITTISLLSILYLWLTYNNNSIAKEASSLIYSDVQKIPPKKAVLVLGTAKYLSGNRINYYYKYRIDSTVELFKAGKVRAIVVSGDNGQKSYDEPTTMRDDLVARGIPSKYITIDYAGFRTLDSIVRAEKIFDLEDYIIVSQRFHLERAIYLARAKGQKITGFVAKDFKGTIWAKRMEYRELLARAKAVIDIYIGVKPKFYGDKVKVIYK
ncbi:SanA protein [hydrothermal vent metagenome]|uniref:SanA protein n=1 Tax=hydrothermal vent metagenome TaxID=652676 RepID=A0A1W1BAT1_9ZZZZ